MAVRRLSRACFRNLRISKWLLAKAVIAVGILAIGAVWFSSSHAFRLGAPLPCASLPGKQACVRSRGSPCRQRNPFSIERRIGSSGAGHRPVRPAGALSARRSHLGARSARRPVSLCQLADFGRRLPTVFATSPACIARM
jgi:hypothetical protein